MVLYNGQLAEEKALDSYFELLYWRLRRLFKVTAFVLFFKQVMANLTTPFSYLVVALVIIRGGNLDGMKPTPKSVLAAFEGEDAQCESGCLSLL